jgi:O-antigen/teichoic acid export membrane protein
MLVHFRSLSNGSLKVRAIRAGTWSLVGYIASSAIRFGSNLILTRLLAPQAFGIVVLASTVTTALAMFSDLGIRQNIVQRHTGDAQFLNTAWTVQIIRGAILCLGGLFVSLAISIASHAGLISTNSVYDDPQLPPVLAALSSIALIAGFESTKLAEANRRLSLGRVVQIELAGQLTGLVCMLIWATGDRSVWLLVAGAVCSSSTSVVLSHAILGGTPNRWAWSAQAGREILRFGRWIFLSSMLYFLAASGDRLLFAGLVDATVFGVYAVAYLLMSTVEQLFSRLVSSVTFPVLSELVRERPERLRHNYYRFYGLIALFGYTGAGALFFSAPSLIGFLYDPRYTQAGWMLQIISASLITLPSAVAVQTFMALGMPQLPALVAAVRAIALFLAVPIGFYLFGVPGALIGIVLSRVLSALVSVVLSVRHGLFNLRNEIFLLPLTLLGALIGKGLSYLLNFDFYRGYLIY